MHLNANWRNREKTNTVHWNIIKFSDFYIFPSFIQNIEKETWYETHKIDLMPSLFSIKKYSKLLNTALFVTSYLSINETNQCSSHCIWFKTEVQHGLLSNTGKRWHNAISKPAFEMCRHRPHDRMRQKHFFSLLGSLSLFLQNLSIGTGVKIECVRGRESTLLLYHLGTTSVLIIWIRFYICSLCVQ